MPCAPAGNQVSSNATADGSAQGARDLASENRPARVTGNGGMPSTNCRTNRQSSEILRDLGVWVLLLGRSCTDFARREKRDEI